MTSVEDWEQMEARWADRARRQNAVAMSVALQGAHQWALDNAEAALAAELDNVIRCRAALEDVTTVLEQRLRELAAGDE